MEGPCSSKAWMQAAAPANAMLYLCHAACRPQRKLMHAALHTLAVICVALALVAAFDSHTKKRPVPTPNLYSPHSYLGLTTLVLLAAQVRLPYTPYGLLTLFFRCHCLPLHEACRWLECIGLSSQWQCETTHSSELQAVVLQQQSCLVGQVHANAGLSLVRHHVMMECRCSAGAAAGTGLC